MKIVNKLGIELHGAVGKELVVSSWKGIPYVRAYVVPRNPRTKGQRRQRGRFSKAVVAWKKLTPAERENYNRAAEHMSGYNLFISQFLVNERKRNRLPHGKKKKKGAVVQGRPDIAVRADS